MGKCLMLGQIMGQDRGSIVTMRKVDLYTSMELPHNTEIFINGQI